MKDVMDNEPYGSFYPISVVLLRNLQFQDSPKSCPSVFRKAEWKVVVKSQVLVLSSGVHIANTVGMPCADHGELWGAVGLRDENTIHRVRWDSNYRHSPVAQNGSQQIRYIVTNPKRNITSKRNAALFGVLEVSNDCRFLGACTQCKHTVGVCQWPAKIWPQKGQPWSIAPDASPWYDRIEALKGGLSCHELGLESLTGKRNAQAISPINAQWWRRRLEIFGYIYGIISRLPWHKVLCKLLPYWWRTTKLDAELIANLANNCENRELDLSGSKKILWTNPFAYRDFLSKIVIWDLGLGAPTLIK
ncbi:hypothetical protein DFH09DRAFT_1284339 [Mycena vulgaris]|nr:hypothetical protein DFH09DRAFT_1284339 [Mycena vulgaris]